MTPPPRMPGSYLVVELTNRCSLACVHCSVSEAGHAHHARTGYIDPALVLGLYADLARVGARFDTLILFWLGEPLLHPHFAAIYQGALRLCVEHGTFRKVEVHTNATHLDAARVQLALNDAELPQVWHFSLDAASQPTYLDIKGMDRFEKVELHVARFVAEKGRTGARWPRPVFQFIVSDKNAHEVPAFRRRWTRACERAGLAVRAAAQNVPGGEDAVVFFRQLDCPTAEEQARQNAVFRAAMAAEGLHLARPAQSPVQVEAHNPVACSGFWKSPVVSWRGEVTVCTRDNLLHNAVGTLAEAPFSELWWGDSMAGRRARVARGDYGGLPACATCFIPKSANYTELEPAEIADLAAWWAAGEAG
ncbi:MAG: SPASM domain-containing protein [Alphaproteobacteria bacterium]|nr:SPASM domain-containing protein [Alphaproteobacteria bacterium]